MTKLVNSSDEEVALKKQPEIKITIHTEEVNWEMLFLCCTLSGITVFEGDSDKFKKYTVNREASTKNQAENSI